MPPKQGQQTPPPPAGDEEEECISNRGSRHDEGNDQAFHKEPAAH
jgi:hypothetical protein